MKTSALRIPLLAAALSALTLVPLSIAQAPAVPESPQAQPIQPTTQHPALFLVGDSIIRTGTGNGDTGPWGWGYEIIPMFDATKIHVYNDALGGRSSRGYIEEGAWAKVLAQLQPGDWVIMHFGHNDAANSANYPDRTTLPGNGDETKEIESPVTHQPETIHTYGWYLRQYVKDVKSKGATMIICSPPPRNTWIDGKIKRGFDGYAAWAQEAAKQTNTLFIDLNTISADKYDALGQDSHQAPLQRQPAQPQSRSPAKRSLRSHRHQGPQNPPSQRPSPNCKIARERPKGRPVKFSQPTKPGAPYLDFEMWAFARRREPPSLPNQESPR